MSRRIRRNPPPALNAKVALAAVKGDCTTTELATRFDGHPTQIAQCNAQRRAKASGAFTEKGHETVPPGAVTTLHAKIGQLPFENDLFEGALSKAG